MAKYLGEEGLKQLSKKIYQCIRENSTTDTTYTFEGGKSKFTVLPSDGNPYDVNITIPSSGNDCIADFANDQKQFVKEGAKVLITDPSIPIYTSILKKIDILESTVVNYNFLADNVYRIRVYKREPDGNDLIKMTLEYNGITTEIESPYGFINSEFTLTEDTDELKITLNVDDYCLLFFSKVNTSTFTKQYVYTNVNGDLQLVPGVKVPPDGIYKVKYHKVYYRFIEDYVEKGSYRQLLDLDINLTFDFNRFCQFIQDNPMCLDIYAYKCSKKGLKWEHIDNWGVPYKSIEGNIVLNHSKYYLKEDRYKHVKHFLLYYLNKSNKLPRQSRGNQTHSNKRYIDIAFVSKTRKYHVSKPVILRLIQQYNIEDACYTYKIIYAENRNFNLKVQL